MVTLSVEKIAEIQAVVDKYATREKARLKAADEAAWERIRSIDLLDWLGQHTNYELSYSYHPYGDEEEEWQVHSVNGEVNDREWTLIGRGSTPREALESAYDRTT